MAERVRVGVVGTSGWANLGHLPALKSHPGAEITAICGRNRDRAAELAGKYDIPLVFTDYRELIERGNLQALLVLAPDDLHYPIVMDALDARLHVLCEKPLALTADQAKAMYEKAEAVGVKHMTFFTYRWFPPFIYLRNLIADGYIGRCFHCNIRYFSGYARDARYRWRFDRRRATGSLGDFGAHMIDLARWYFGDIARVSAHLATSVLRDGFDGQPLDPANDSAVLTVEFRNGIQGVIHVSAVAYTGASFQDFQCQEVTLHGEAGSLSAFVSLGGAEVHGLRHDEPQIHPLPIPDELWGDVPHTSPVTVLVKHPVGGRAFIDAILEDHPATPSFYDGWKAQEVIDAMLMSDQEGRWVALAE